jgi:16S rRNA (cytidine1402-2'-O)-methyltransferase
LAESTGVVVVGTLPPLGMTDWQAARNRMARRATSRRMANSVPNLDTCPCAALAAMTMFMTAIPKNVPGSDSRAPNKPLETGLYVVATPIGNLGDLSLRAIDLFRQADLVAVEDSRVTGKLLNHLGIKARMRPYHDHSSDYDRADLIAAAQAGVVVLVSDAGTPLISDPGYKLVRDARAAGVAVRSVPGPSAAVAALSISGLPTDRFLFAGFLPAKAKARAEAIAELAGLDATLVFYESGPRLAASLAALAAGLGERQAVVARELTKLHEEVVGGSLCDLAGAYAGREPKGEIVLIVGPPEEKAAEQGDVDAALREALGRLPASKAAGEIARRFGVDRAGVYARAMALKPPA